MNATVGELNSMIVNRRIFVDSCILCGAPPAYGGVFEPSEDQARRLGQPKGKKRFILYAVCSRCMIPEDSPQSDIEPFLDKVEGEIFRRKQVH